MNYVPPITAPNTHVCPHCGYCPHCGGHRPRPYPYGPVWINHPTVTC